MERRHLLRLGPSWSENLGLEHKINDRTKDLEHRAKELHEKNKDLEKFAYVVSHDLKRPLRNIHTLAEWLTESVDQNEEEILGINSTRLLHDFAHPIDQPLDLTCHQFVETLV